MLKHAPIRVDARGRLYVRDEHYRRLDCDPADAPHEVAVGVVMEHRTDHGVQGRFSTFETTLTPDNYITIPKHCRTYMEVTEGDRPRVTVSVIS